MQILDISNILDVEEHSYVDYGREELESLIEFYGADKTINNVKFQLLVDPNAIQGEFRLFKRMVTSNSRKMTNDNFGYTCI